MPGAATTVSITTIAPVLESGNRESVVVHPNATGLTGSLTIDLRSGVRIGTEAVPMMNDGVWLNSNSATNTAAHSTASGARIRATPEAPGEASSSANVFGIRYDVADGWANGIAGDVAVTVTGGSMTTIPSAPTTGWGSAIVVRTAQQTDTTSRTISLLAGVGDNAGNAVAITQSSGSITGGFDNTGIVIHQRGARADATTVTLRQRRHHRHHDRADEAIRRPCAGGKRRQHRHPHHDECGHHPLHGLGPADGQQGFGRLRDRQHGLHRHRRDRRHRWPAVRHPRGRRRVGSLQDRPRRHRLGVGRGRPRHPCRQRQRRQRLHRQRRRHRGRRRRHPCGQELRQRGRHRHRQHRRHRGRALRYRGLVRGRGRRQHPEQRRHRPGLGRQPGERRHLRRPGRGQRRRDRERRQRHGQRARHLRAQHGRRRHRHPRRGRSPRQDGGGHRRPYGTLAQRGCRRLSLPQQHGDRQGRGRGRFGQGIGDPWQGRHRRGQQRRRPHRGERLARRHGDGEAQRRHLRLSVGSPEHGRAHRHRSGGGAITAEKGVYALVSRASAAGETRTAAAQPLIDIAWTGTFTQVEHAAGSLNNVAHVIEAAQEGQAGVIRGAAASAGIDAEVISWRVLNRTATTGDDPGEIADKAAQDALLDTASTNAAVKARAEAILTRFRTVLTVGTTAIPGAGAIDADDDDSYNDAELVAYLSADSDARRSLLRSVLSRHLSGKERAVLEAVAAGGDVDAALDDEDAGFSDAYKAAVKALLASHNAGDIRIAMNAGSIASGGDGIRAWYAMPHDRNGAIAVTVAEGASVTGAAAGVYVANAGDGLRVEKQHTSPAVQRENEDLGAGDFVTFPDYLDQVVRVNGTAAGGNGVYVDAQAAVTRYDVELTSMLGRTLKDGANGMGYALAVEAGRPVALGGT